MELPTFLGSVAPSDDVNPHDLAGAADGEGADGPDAVDALDRMGAAADDQ